MKHFTHDGVDYRVDRGVGTSHWIVTSNAVPNLGWAFLFSIDDDISEADIIEHVKSLLH
jgi:hypothetical protein